MAERTIVHVDLDAFFANAEVLRRPELHGRPVIVGGDPDGRGVVSSATYAARAHGVRSAMPVAHARRLCPHATFLQPDFPYYRDLAHRFRAILHDTSPIVEIASIDEAYLDATGLIPRPTPTHPTAHPTTHASQTAPHLSTLLPPLLGWGEGVASRSDAGGETPPHRPDADAGNPNLPAFAHTIKARLIAETGLTCSIGIAPNKILAKIASDLRKPDGLVIVPPDAAAAFLAPLPAGALPGVGPKAQARLAALGLRTVGDLAAAAQTLLRRVFGERIAIVVAQRAQGRDDRPLETSSAPKTLGHERTFATDIASVATLRRVIRDLAEQNAAQLRRAGLGARTVSLKLRDERFETLGRQRALPGSTELADPIRSLAEALLDDIIGTPGAPWHGRRIRLLGVRVGGLGPLARQLHLFDPAPQRAARLHAALDQLHDRFGPDAIHSASRSTR